MLFGAKNWSDARSEYADVLPELAGADRERAELRILECGVALGSRPGRSAGAARSAIPMWTPSVYDALAEYYRGQQQEPQMVAAVEAVDYRARHRATGRNRRYFSAGNYYWVQLDRDRASGYYKRLEENFPTSTNATAASQWRVAWTRRR